MALVVGSLFIAHEVLKYNAKKTQSDAITDKDGVAIDLSPRQWAEFRHNGFVKVGRTMTDEEVKAIQQRTKDIMSGAVRYGDKLLMQADISKDTSVSSKAEYDQNAVSGVGQSTGFKGDNVKYRKIGECGHGLECDDVFLRFMRKPIFRRICDEIYGKHCSINVYRSMIFNKPALKDGGGTFLPWHQDGGNWWSIDRDPLVFCWTALKDVDIANGGVECVRGSHKLGILSARGHTISDEHIKKYCTEDKIVKLEAKAGETWLCHNWIIHRSGRNMTDRPRWGFSANYMDGRTKMLNPPAKGAGPLADLHCKFGEIFPSPVQ
eukprot:541181_1